MPNWCDNVLKISKEGCDLAYIAERLESEGLFQQFIPVPKDLSDHAITDYCYNNWGVKWEANISSWDIDHSAQTLTISFMTPWSAPNFWLQWMVANGYQVSGAFWESGMLMGGVYHTDGSNLIWNQDNMVEKGSEMYELLSSYELIWDDGWEETVE